MITVEQLEQALENLSLDERASFRAWYAVFDAAEWDQQFDADVAAGTLDRLADAALTEHSTGRSRKFEPLRRHQLWRCYDALPAPIRNLGVVWWWIGTHAEYDRLVG